MAVVYALIVGLFVYRGLKLKDLIPVIRSTCHTTAIIMLIVGMAKAFSYVMINNRLPENVAAFILQTTSNPVVILLLINVVSFDRGLLHGGQRDIWSCSSRCSTL